MLMDTCQQTHPQPTSIADVTEHDISSLLNNSMQSSWSGV